MILREVQYLETREIADLPRKTSGEGVVLEEDRTEESELRERRRYRAVEGVGPKAELLQHLKVGDAVAEASRELKLGEADLGDTASAAGHPAPVAGGGGCGGIPSREGT